MWRQGSECAMNFPWCPPVALGHKRGGLVRTLPPAGLSAESDAAIHGWAWQVVVQKGQNLIFRDKSFTEY